MKNKAFLDDIKSLVETEIIKVAVTLQGEYLAMLKDGERFQTLPLSSKEFSLALRAYYQKRYNADLTPGNMQDIRYYLESKAYENKLDYALSKRIYNAGNEQIIYDLNKDNGMAVFIEDGECEIAPVEDWIFQRCDMYKNQVTPNLKKNINPQSLPKYIEKHFNLKNKNEKKLFSLYLISCFWGLSISHPVLFLSAEQGSGKSTFLRKLERLIDPKTIDLPGLPHGKDGLELRMSNSYFVALDNLSYISRNTSDLIARIVTGGSSTKRALYENTKEVSVDVKGILAINSVSMIFKEPDVLDRMLILSLSRFKTSENRAESEIWDEFEKDLPDILGCCFKCLAIALNDKEPIPSVERIRLADYQECCIHIGRALGYTPEEVTDLLFMNQKRVNQEAVCESVAGQCLIEFMKNRDFYKNSVTHLLKDLKKFAVKIYIDPSQLPNRGNSLSRELNKIKSNLEQEYDIAFHIHNSGSFKEIKINKVHKIIDNTDNG